MYSDNRQGRPDVYFRDSADGGVTWGQAALLNDRSKGGAFLPDVSVSPDGRIDVVYYERRDDDVDEVIWTHSLDGGATFARAAAQRGERRPQRRLLQRGR